MAASEHLGQQFTGRVPVEQVFKRPQINNERLKKWHDDHLTRSVTRTVPTDALHPTQSHVNMDHIYSDRVQQWNPMAIQDGRGRYSLVDGHHRVARALLEGVTHMDVDVLSKRSEPDDAP